MIWTTYPLIKKKGMKVNWD